MTRPQDGRKISIDKAVETVIAEATAAAVGKCCAELKGLKEQLDSATKNAGSAVKALETATENACKAVESGEWAIRKLRHTVWAVASMPFFSATAELWLWSVKWFDIAPASVSLEDEVVRAIGRFVGVLPLAGLVSWRGARLARQKIQARRKLGTRDAGPPEP